MSGQPTHTRRCLASSVRSRAGRDADGFTLVDLLVATAVALAALAAVSAALPPILDTMQAVPEAADLHQRSRATEAVVSGMLTSAGAGAALLGEGPLSRTVPAIWPRRLLGSADPAGTAWADRLTLLRVDIWAAQAPTASSLGAGSSVVPIAWHPACGGDASCGFRRGDLVVVRARTGAMAMATLASVAGLVLTLASPVDEAIPLPASVSVVEASALSFDAARRQLRRADGSAPSQPVTDDVVAFRFRYYGTPAAPRSPAVPGSETCVVAADGTPKLGLLGPVPGPPVELTLAELIDGPWCGTGQWRYDADLLRLQAVRVAMRLQAVSPAVRGVLPTWFAMPGSARRVSAEVRDVEMDVFVRTPNLAWSQ